jgi:photosystem II stability/assembly factor-like uncharacterized protein
MRLNSLIAILLAVSGASAAWSQVGDALHRPALQVKAPAKAVLIAVAQAGARFIAVGERGLVVLSDDQGRSWRQVPCPVSVGLTMVRFSDERHGVVIGHGGTVMTTADGGESWVVRLDGRKLASQLQTQASTPDARQKAERLIADGPDKPLLDVVLWDAKRMLVVGAYGLALHTEDGGLNWTSWMERIPNPSALHWYVARRQGNMLLLAGEQGLLVRSADAGVQFEALPTPYKGSWFAGLLADGGRVVLAGLRGNAWSSQDFGSTWIRLKSSLPSTITSMATDAKGRVWLASQAGVLLRQEGDSLLPLNTTPVPMPAALLPIGDGNLLVAGATGVRLVQTEGVRP